MTEIAIKLDVHKSTISRLLSTLELRGLVEQNFYRGNYRIGYGVVQLAAGAAKKHDLSVASDLIPPSSGGSCRSPEETDTKFDHENLGGEGVSRRRLPHHRS